MSAGPLLLPRRHHTNKQRAKIKLSRSVQTAEKAKIWTARGQYLCLSIQRYPICLPLRLMGCPRTYIIAHNKRSLVVQLYYFSIAQPCKSRRIGQWEETNTTPGPYCSLATWILVGLSIVLLPPLHTSSLIELHNLLHQASPHHSKTCQRSNPAQFKPLEP